MSSNPSSTVTREARDPAQAAISAGFFPLKPHRLPKGTASIDLHALGFVVGVEGAWTSADLSQFRDFLRTRRLTPTDEEVSGSLARAKRKYLNGEHRMFLCTADPCCRERHFDDSQTGLASSGRLAGLPISATGCQGHCKQAPVLSIRIGSQSQVLGRVSSEEDWGSALSYIKSTVQADSLLVNPGNACGFVYDPAHESVKPDCHLKPLEFLLGRFRGVGRCADSGYTFQKETLGTLEAGGRFIALRMAASYPLPSGRKDTHRALVMVGTPDAASGLTGRAYTDGGDTRDYKVEEREGALVFADSVPDHSRDWIRARKLLKQTNEGFEERLEADAGNGFATYYSIAMKRIQSP